MAVHGVDVVPDYISQRVESRISAVKFHPEFRVDVNLLDECLEFVSSIVSRHGDFLPNVLHFMSSAPRCMNQAAGVVVFEHSDDVGAHVELTQYARGTYRFNLKIDGPAVNRICDPGR